MPLTTPADSGWTALGRRSDRPISGTRRARPKTLLTALAAAIVLLGVTASPAAAAPPVVPAASAFPTHNGIFLVFEPDSTIDTIEVSGVGISTRTYPGTGPIGVVLVDGLVDGTAYVVHYRAHNKDGWSSDQATGAVTPAPYTSRTPTTVAIRGLDGALWTRGNVGGSATWGAWTSLGGAIQGSPSVAPWLGIAARGMDNSVWVNTQSWTYEGGGGPHLTPAGWTPWGGATHDEPAMSSVGVAIRGLDGAVWFRADASTPWVPLGGRSDFPPVWSRGSDLAIRGLDGALWINTYDDSGHTWSGWSSLGGRIVGAPMAAGSGLGGVGQDRHVWTRQKTGSAYTEWADIGGHTDQHPAGTIYGFVVKGLDGGLWSSSALPNADPPTGFRAWAPVGGTFVGPPVADGFGEVIVRAADGSIWSNYIEPLGPDGWVSLGGGTADLPALGAAVG